MPEMQDFDPDIYFGIAAENLLRNFGERALYYAEEALKKMRALGDDDGFDMWLGIQRQMIARIRRTHIPEDATIH